jgi:hypothetical protein
VTPAFSRPGLPDRGQTTEAHAEHVHNEQCGTDGTRDLDHRNSTVAL